MKRICYTLTLFLPLTLLLSWHSVAQEHQPVFQVFDQEPYSYQAPNGENVGYHYQIANLILQEAGYSAKAVAVPLKRAIRDLSEGHADCMLAARSPFALSRFAAIEDIGHDLLVGILPRNGIDLHIYDDLQGLRIGIPAGMSIGDPFDSDTRLKKVPTPDYLKSTLMMTHDRIDAIMGSIESIRFAASKASKQEPMEFGKPLITQQFPIALFCRKEQAESQMVKRLGAATKILREKAVIKNVIGSFFAF